MKKSLDYIGQSAVIMLGGFVLFNVAFILAFGVHTVSSLTIMPWVKGLIDPDSVLFSWHYIYMILIMLISVVVLRLNLSPLIKATYLTMPIMVFLVEIGLNFYLYQPVVIGLSIAFITLLLLLIYKKKLPWQYYFSTLYVAILAVIIMVMDIQI